MNIDETAKYVALCAAMWPSWKPNAATVDAWHLVLNETPYALARNALVKEANSDFPPPPGRIADFCGPKPVDEAEIIRTIDTWYRENDDLTRRPNFEDRESHPSAALAWTMVGGFEALHERSWAHQRIRSVLPKVNEIIKTRAMEEHLGITSGEARGFVRELENRTPKVLRLGQ